MRLIKYAIAILLLGQVCWAEPLRTWPADGGVQEFLGLDDTSAPTQVQDGRAQSIQNIELDSGSIRKRYGASLACSTDLASEGYEAVTGIYYTKFSSGT